MRIRRFFICIFMAFFAISGIFSVSMKYSVSVPLSANEELSADFEFVLKNCGYRLDSVFGESGPSVVASVFFAGGDLARNEPLFPVALPSAASELFSGIRAGFFKKNAGFRAYSS